MFTKRFLIKYLYTTGQSLQWIVSYLSEYNALIVTTTKQTYGAIKINELGKLNIII